VDAQLLTAPETTRLLEASGFRRLATDFFLYLPESLFRNFGIVEGIFSKVPLGGQYALMARKQ
jgi:hypothetical protein